MTNISTTIISNNWVNYNLENYTFDFETNSVYKNNNTICCTDGNNDGLETESVYDVDTLSSSDYYDMINGCPSMFDDTMSFQIKYGLYDPNVFGFLPEENMKVKIGHLQEEMAEVLKAYENKDLNEFCDGILDLVYVGLGTLALMNMPANALWTDIQIRNMNKIRATADTVGKRGSTFDVVKPAGWTGPRTAEIISEHKKRIDKARNLKES